MLIFASGYFMNLYYLFVVASITLYWAIMFKYGIVSKKIREIEDPIKRAIESKKKLAKNWKLVDILMLNMILLSLHFDRYVLEAWRFLDFERTFTYAYDAENFFTYPIFLFQVGVMMLRKSRIEETL